MPDLLMAGMQWLNGRHEAAVSFPCVYRRGKHSVNRNFSIGRNDMLLSGEFGGTQLRTQEKAFIDNNPAALIICGEQITPQTGDLIEIVENGNTSRYGVRIPDGGEQEFEWDEMRTSMRIHTKFLKVTNGCLT